MGRVWIGNGRAPGMSPQAAAWGAWYSVHCQGELEVQHFAGLQQYLGYSVLCSGLGCNDMESPT